MELNRLNDLSRGIILEVRKISSLVSNGFILPLLLGALTEPPCEELEKRILELLGKRMVDEECVSSNFMVDHRAIVDAYLSCWLPQKPHLPRNLEEVEIGEVERAMDDLSLEERQRLPFKREKTKINDRLKGPPDGVYEYQELLGERRERECSAISTRGR